MTDTEETRITDLLRQLEACNELRATLVLESRKQALELQRMNANLKDAERDRRRLDWLEANPRSVTYSQGYLKSASGWIYRDLETTAHVDAESLRAAIDAANPANPTLVKHKDEDAPEIPNLAGCTCRCIRDSAGCVLHGGTNANYAG